MDKTHLEKTAHLSHCSPRTMTLFPLKALPENPVKVHPARTPTTSMSFLMSTMVVVVELVVVDQLTCIPNRSSSNGTCAGLRATQDSNPQSISN